MSKSKAASGAGALFTAVLGAGFIQGMIPVGVIPATGPNIERAYNLTHTEWGNIIFWCQLVGGAVGGLFGGWLCGRIGGLPALLLSVVIGTVALGAVGLVPGMIIAFSALTVYYLSKSIMNSANALATKMVPDAQRGVGVLHGVNAMGKVGGALLAFVFVAAAWRNTYLVSGLLTLILTVPILLSWQHSHASAGRKQAGGRAGLYFWIAVLGFAFIAGGEMASAMWIPSYGENILNLAERPAKILFVFFATGIVLGRFLFAGLSHRVSSRGAIALTCCAALFVFPALYFQSYAVVALFLMLYGLTFSAIWPSYFAQLSRVFPEHLGLMAGVSAFTTCLGLAVCAKLSAPLAQIHEAYGILFGAGVIVLFVALFFLSPLSRLAKAVQET